MGLSMLWFTYVAFAVLLAASGAALFAATQRRNVAWSLALLATLPLLALHVYWTGQACDLRFGNGIEHAPWRFATSLVFAHLIASSWLVVRGVSGASLFGWSAGRLALAALLAFGFSITTLRMLDLEARLTLSDLRVEAGQIAYALTPALPDASTNAAPVYERVGEELYGGDDFVDLGDFRKALTNERPLDASDAELRALLARTARSLDEIRAASALPNCRFTAKNELEPVVAPRVLPLVRVSQLLLLSSRVRAHDGDTSGAIDDVVASLRMVEHLVHTPTLVAFAAGTAMRNEALATLLHVVASSKLSAADLARLESALGTEFASFAPNAARMEEAYGLSMLGSALTNGESGFAGIDESMFDWTGPHLYGPFMLRDDVRGYREVMGEFAVLARASHRELVAANDDPAHVANVRRRGLIATLMATNMTRFFAAAHRSDAHAALTRLALAAARERLDHGVYPTQFGAWSGDVTNVGIESDGNTIRLFRTDSADLGESLEVSLPPRPLR